MRKGIKIFVTSLMALLLVMGSFSQDVLATEELDMSTSLNGKGYTKPQSLGTAIDTVTSLTSAVYDVYDGKLMAYSMANGGIFNAVDVKENKLVYSELAEGISQVWGHTVTHDGVVYMAALGPNNDGQLLRYNPKQGKLESLGTPLPGHQFWSITSDGDKNIFIGTFKEGEGSVVKYDILLNKFENMGVADPVNKAGYVRSIAYHDGSLYLGTGVQGRLVKMDINTKVTTDLTANAYDIINKPGNKYDIKFAYDMAVVKNHILVRFDDGGEGAILFFNLLTQEWENKKLGKKHDGGVDDFGAFGWNQLVDLDGVTYVTYERHLHEIDTNTMSDKRVGQNFLGHRGGSVFDLGEGDEFISLSRLGETVRFNLEKNTKKTVGNVMKGSPLKLHNLGKDDKGDLYVTTYPGGPRGAKYSMDKQSYVSYNQGQAEGLVAGEPGEMYFGIYPGAVIQRMNTNTQEIETLFNLKSEHEQDRPYIMKYEDGLLLVGTIPDYQKLGGTLSIYNPKTKELQTHRNVVKDQSIVGLAKKGNLIFGSTTTKGGLDVNPTATKPVIFVWDIAGKQKIKEIELNIPGLGQTPMISGLTFDEKGMLWGAVDGFLFTVDLDTYQVVNYKNIYPNIQNRGMWRPVHIEMGEDGFVYSDVGGRLTVVDPSTSAWEHTTVATAKEVDFMTLTHDKDGKQNIYIVQADPIGIDEIKIVDVDPTDEDDSKIIARVLKTVTNGKFEDLRESETESTDPKKPFIHGWSSLFDIVSANVSYGISKEQVFSGDHSLKIMDQSAKETVFVISDPISIEANETYIADIMLYLKDGMNTLMMRYYDENGKQVGADADNVNIIHVRSNYNTWQNVKATVKAPANAKTARISLGSSNYFQTSGAYFDEIKLYSNKELTALKLKKLMASIVDFDSIVEEDFTEISYQEALNHKNRATALIAKANEEAELFEVGIDEASFNARITQVQVDEHLTDLEEAMAALVGKTDPVDPVDPVDPIDPVDPVDPTEPNDKVDVEPKPENPKNENLPATGVSQVNTMAISMILIAAGGILILLRKHVGRNKI